MKIGNTEGVPTMDELRDHMLQKDAETLAKLIGKPIVHLTNEWDVNRNVYRKFYDIKEISSVELECEPHKAIILNFTKGNPIMFLNLEQFEEYYCKIDEYGSIQEYLKAMGFSAFD